MNSYVNLHHPMLRVALLILSVPSRDFLYLTNLCPVKWYQVVSSVPVDPSMDPAMEVAAASHRAQKIIRRTSHGAPWLMFHPIYDVLCDTCVIWEVLQCRNCSIRLVIGSGIG